MARQAGNVCVAEGQREAGKAVIKIRRVPTLRRVAVGTVGQGENRARSRVNGVSRLLPGGEVTAGIAAVCRCDLQIVVVVDVAIGAGNVCVTVDQQKACRRVIEFRVQPCVETVASFASRRKLRTRVIGIGGFLVVLQMARSALR